MSGLVQLRSDSVIIMVQSDRVASRSGSVTLHDTSPHTTVRMVNDLATHILFVAYMVAALGFTPNDEF